MAHFPHRGFTIRERKMRTKFFCTNFLNTAKGPGHPGKIPGTSRIPLFETQGRQSFEGGHEVFGHHPFAWKTPTPPGGLRTQKLNLCALCSCLNNDTNVIPKTFRSCRPKVQGSPRPPTRHRGLPGPSGPEPRKSPKRVRTGVPPQGAPDRRCA